MKRIKLSLICTAALMLALPLAGCANGENLKSRQREFEQTIETEDTQNEECPDGRCPDDGDCPDGDKCPEDDKCPHGKRPPWKIGKRRRAEPLPCPHQG